MDTSVKEKKVDHSFSKSEKKIITQMIVEMHYSLDEFGSELSQNYVRFFIAPKMDDDE